MAVTSELGQIFKGPYRQYQKRQVIIGAGENPAGVFLIDEGYVKVYSIAENGSLRVHIFYGAGDVFPLIWALRAERRQVFYEAMTDLRVLQMPREKFQEITQGNLDAAIALNQKLVDMFRLYADRLENLEHSSAPQKVAYRLTSLVDRFGSGGVLAAPFTHQDIADSLHISRETVSRAIEHLARQGIIQTTDHRIEIVDHPKLEALLDR